MPCSVGEAEREGRYRDCGVVAAQGGDHPGRERVCRWGEHGGASALRQSQRTRSAFSEALRHVPGLATQPLAVW